MNNQQKRYPSIMRWDYISIGAGVSALLFAALTLIKAPLGVFYGFVAGILGWPHFILLNMLGAFLGRYVLSRRFGGAQWCGYSPILLAGVPVEWGSSA